MKTRDKLKLMKAWTLLFKHMKAVKEPSVAIVGTFGTSKERKKVLAAFRTILDMHWEIATRDKS